MRWIIISLCLCWAIFTCAQADTTITYQGQLQDSSGPVDASVDMTFALYNDETGGDQVGSTISLTDVIVVDGLFKVGLDFGEQAYNSGLWLAIEIEGEPLSPRQAITGAPFAVSVAPGSGSNWERSIASRIYFDHFMARVGIGTSSPTVELHVVGSAQFGSGSNASGMFSFVGGGSSNTAEGGRSFVGGGSGNTAEGTRSFVGGGTSNTAEAFNSFVGGGWNNSAEALRSFVAGGRDNSASGDDSFVGGGQDNSASGAKSFAGGGQDNSASGDESFVGGGSMNSASGIRSFAAGRRAKAEHDGTFVWGDNTNTDFASTDTNQFLIRAGGGVGINTSNPDNSLTVAGDADFIGAVGINTASPDRELHIRQRSTNASNIGLQIEDSGGSNNWALYVAVSNNLGFRFNDELKSRINASDGAYVQASDRRLKEDIQPLVGVLDSVLALEPSSYYFRADQDRSRHSIGLIAQDVQQLFPAAVIGDEDQLGISYSEITVLNTQALIEMNARFEDRMVAQHDRLLALEAENAELQTQVATLKDESIQLRELAERNAELEARLVALETVLIGDEQVAGAQ